MHKCAHIQMYSFLVVLFEVYDSDKGVCDLTMARARG